MESLGGTVRSVLTFFLELPHFGHSTDFELLSSALKAFYSGSEGGQEALTGQQSVGPPKGGMDLSPRRSKDTNSTPNTKGVLQKTISLA